MNEESEREVIVSIADDEVSQKTEESSTVAQGEGDSCYRFFFEASNDGMLLATTDGAILDANPHACRLLQQTQEELIAGGRAAVFDTSDPWLEPALEEQRKTGRFRDELHLLRRDGASFLAEVSIGTYRDETGERLSIIFRDITERKQAEYELRSSEAQFRAMVENALDLIALCNPDNTFRYINPALEQVLGYRPEEVLGTVIPDLIHPEDIERFVDEMSQGIIERFLIRCRAYRDPLAAQGRLLSLSRVGTSTT